MYNLPPPNLGQNYPAAITPDAPEDPEQKNIIDKLASFVARNGPEFENVTKEKQKDNPKFAFLFGGPQFSYYQFRLAAERETARMPPIHNMSLPPPIPSIPVPAMHSLQQIPMMQAQINITKDQIQQSEHNLSAQRDAFKVKTKAQIDEAIAQKQVDEYNTLLKESQLDLASLQPVIDKIVEACTKEAIAAGRNFVFMKCLGEKKIQMVCYYLRQKIMSKESDDTVRLHLIYFMNDMIHHGNKKGIELVKKHLELIIVPCFCHAIENVEPERQTKMNKLLDLWEKNKYFSGFIVEKLRNPEVNCRLCEEALELNNVPLVERIESEAKQQLDTYEKQNTDFIEHSNNQINFIQAQINQIIQQQILVQQQQQKMQEDFIRQQQMSQQFQPQQLQTTPNKPPSLMSLMAINTPQPASPINSNNPPPAMSISPGPTDFTRPPPGFSLPPPSNNIQPNIPPPPTPPQLPTDFAKQYYSLPAGLICPLVKPDEIDHVPLDPKLIELPKPEAPSEQLVKVVEEFYAVGEEGALDLDGWQVQNDSLYELFKMKIKLKLQKRVEMNLEKENRKRQRSRSRSRKRSRSRSRSRRRSRSKSSNRHRRHRSYSSSRSRSSSRSSGSSRSRSRSRTRSRSNSRRPTNSSLSSSRQRSRSPPARTPPPHPRAQFTAASSMMPSPAGVSLEQRIDPSNKGHMLLAKMGYSGAGLGRKEQGIVNPIKGGEVRGRNEQFRGIGVKSDPFEAFRKNKSQGYIQRLRTRDEVRKDKGPKKSQEPEYDY